MKYELDASVAIKLAIAEPDSHLAEPLLRAELHAPDLLYAEVANILWKKLAREELTDAIAAQALDVIGQLRVSITPSKVLLTDAAWLARTAGHPAYDMFYVALAQELSAPLITADRRLSEKVRQITPRPPWASLVTSLTEFQPGASAPSPA
ncbi:type II toxin-antitoxin system VapC family toxin [Niveispirillum fermenti]|uniref:type II toxin-antitoxin system VapC family toxin n=1 Tax=Niveispirillum fermenti TaxID=1233113 RepID=UPI003A892ED2